MKTNRIAMGIWMVAAFVVLAVGGTAQAATYTNAASGNWVANTTWSAPIAGHPGSGDTAVFSGTTGYIVTNTSGDQCDVVNVVGNATRTWQGDANPLTVNIAFTNTTGTGNLQTSLAGAGRLVVSGGTLSIFSNNTYSGGTMLSGSGTLSLNNAGALGSGVFTNNGTSGSIGVSAASGITLDGRAPQVWSANFNMCTASGQGNQLNTGTNTVTLAGNVTVSAGRGSGQPVTLGGILKMNGYNLTINVSGSSLVLSSNITGTGSIIAAGASGFTVIAASNSWTGNVTLNNGGASAAYLRLDNAGALGDKIFTNNSAGVGVGCLGTGSQLTLDGRAPQVWIGNMGLGYSATYGMANDFNTGTNTVTLGGNVNVTFGVTARTIILGGPISLGGYNLTFGGTTAGTLVIASNVTGNASVIVNQSGGTLQFSAATDFGGTTTNTAGTLKLSHALALQNSTYVGNGGVLVFDSGVSPRAFTFGGLGGSSSLALTNSAAAPNDVTLSVGNNNQNTTYSGVLRGSGGLTKIGTGILTLSAGNTNTGPTVVSAGTLLVDGGLSNGPVTVVSGGALAGSGTIGGIVTNSGTLGAGSANSMGTGSVSKLTLKTNLVLTANSTIAWDIDNTTNDIVQVNGNVTVVSGVCTVKLYNAGYTGPTPTAQYDVIKYLGTGPNSGFAVDASATPGWNPIVVADPSGKRVYLDFAATASKPSLGGCTVTGVTANAAWMNGSLAQTNGAPTGWGVIWGTGTNDGTINSLWPNGSSVGFGGGVDGVSTSYQAMGLALAGAATTTYYVSFWATNSAGTNITTPVVFSTSNAVPVIALASPSTNNVTAISANLLGNLTSTGAWPTAVFAVWGYSNSASLNSTSTAVNAPGTGGTTNQATGLIMGSNYAFTVFATNASGTCWAPTTNYFTTPIQAITNVVATNITGAAADLVGNLTSTGGAPAWVWCFWGTNSASLDYSSNLGQRVTGLVTNHATGLLSGTTNYFRFLVSNATATAWAPTTNSFVTLAVPTVYNQAFSTLTNLPVNITLTGDSALGGNPTFTILSLPASGTLTNNGVGITSVPAVISGATLAYTPGAVNTTNTFTFTGNNGSLDSNTGTVTIVVAGGWFTLGSNQNLNGWANLYATNNTCIIVPSNGVYNWADKDGNGNPALYGLDMKSFNIVTTDGTNFTLNLNGGAITNGGALKTVRAGPAKDITVTNAGPITVGDIDTSDTASTEAFPSQTRRAAGQITVSHRGALSAGNVYAYANGTYNRPGSISFNGDSGMAGGSKGAFVSGNLDVNSYSGWPSNQISIQGYTDVLINGYVYGYVSNRDGDPASLVIGATNATVGNVTIRGLIDLHPGSFNTLYPSAGSLSIYGTGNVLLQDSGSVPQDFKANTSVARGTDNCNVTISHDGQLVFNDISVVKSPATKYWTYLAEAITFNGDALADGPSGSLTGHDILGYCTAISVAPSFSVNISGYTGVSLRTVDTHGEDVVTGGSSTHNCGAIAITNIAGPIDIGGNLITSNALTSGSLAPGAITLQASGDITVGGAINAWSGRGANYNGVLTVSATGAASRITLNSLNLSLVKNATFSAGGGVTVITNQLLNFPTNACGNGQLDATNQPVQQYIRYDRSLAANAYLLGTSNGIYTLKSGGLLTWQSPAVITNSGYSGASSTGATLQATLVSTGGAPTTVFCFWGTNTAPWTWSSNLGTWAEGPVSNVVQGLQESTSYSFTFAASNFLGMVWAPTTGQFATISAAYGAPVASNVSVTTAENTATNITLTGGSANPSPVWSSAIQSGPAHGILTPVSAMVWTYTPTQWWSGADSFTFKVYDGAVPSDNVGTGAVTVTFVNYPPTVYDQALTIPLNTPRTIGLQGTDVHGSNLTFSIVQAPSHAQSYPLVGSNVTYTPVNGYEGPDSFTFKASNGLDSNTGTVSLLIGWFKLGANLNLTNNAVLVATNNMDAITNNPAGYYNWADKHGNGSGFSALYGLDMKGFNLTNANGDSFTLNLNGGAITNGGALVTSRGGQAGNIVVTNAGAIALGSINTSESAANTSPAGNILVNHRGALTAGDVLAYSAFTSGNGTPGSISFNGDSGTAAGTKGSFSCGNIDAHGGGGGRTNHISIQNYNDVLVNGHIYGYIAYRDADGASLYIGTNSARVGNVTIRGQVNLYSAAGYSSIPYAMPGNILMYSTGNVLFQDAGNAAQDILSYINSAGRDGNNVTINHAGQLVFNDMTITKSTSSANWSGTGAGAIALNGDGLGNGPSGMLSARDIFGASYAIGMTPSHSVTISGYTNVSLRTVDTHGDTSGSASGGDKGTGAIAITNIAGAIAIGGNLVTSNSWSSSPVGCGAITLQASGDIGVAGAIAAGSGGGTNYSGVVTVSATGAASRVTLGSLDMGTVKTATFYAGGGVSIITNQLLNFPTNACGNGHLDAGNAPVQQYIRYDSNVTANAYLLNVSNGIYRLKSGGFLTWQFGPIITNDAATSLTHTSEVLNATLVTTGGLATTVTCFWGPDAAHVTNSAAATISGTSASYTLNGLAPASSNWFTFMASNLFGVSWAPTTNAFRTLDQPPAITNQAATVLDASSATLNGYLVSTGTAATTVYCYWGKTSTGPWPNSASFAAGAPGAVQVPATGLDTNTQYWFTYMASNVGGAAWAPTTNSFATMALPAIANLRATNVAMNTATLVGSLSSTGSAAVTVYWYWWRTGLASNSGSMSVSDTGEVTAAVSGLLLDTDYQYTFMASNVYGVSWATPPDSFRTKAPEGTVFRFR